MAINTNVNPYYDDFDDLKNFHQILFKPGFAVQARELTQLQSMLQDQIKKFGGHIFKHGSVVIPGNSTSDLNSQYVKLKTVNTSLVTENIEGKILVGGTNNLEAYVRKYVPATDTDPATVYLNYLKGSTASNVFVADEILTIKDTSNTITVASESPSGVGSLAFINDGVFYINGRFVNVKKQTAVLQKYSSVPHGHVVLRIQESIVNSETDDTLFDPAQGSYNYAAPGADRHKITLTLDTIPYNNTLSDDLIEIMRYNNGVLEEHVRYPKYNELEKNLARRTYDESGDYVVNGLDVTVRENKKIDVNGGFDVNGSIDKFTATVSAGKAYINGFENEKLSETNLTLDKARTSDHVKTKDISVNVDFGQYLFVGNLPAVLPFDVQLKTVTLYDNKTGGNSIGTAIVSGMDFHGGNYIDATGVYRLYFNEMTLDAGKTAKSIGAIVYTVNSVSYRMTVLHKFVVPGSAKDFATTEQITNSQTTPKTANVHYWERATSSLYVYKGTNEIPVLSDVVTGGTSGAVGSVVQAVSISSSTKSAQIFELPSNAISKVKNSSNISDIKYKVFKNISFTVTGTGAESTTINSGTIDTPLDVGNCFFVGPSGVIALEKFSASGNTLTVTNAGFAGTIWGVVSVNKTLSEKSKTKTTTSETFTVTSPAVVTSATLSKSDVIAIKSIVSSGTDVTENYVLDNGQKDYAYLNGTLTLKSGSTGYSSITVTYEYFEHGSGDYFTADSYSNLGTGYLDLIPSYVSKSDGTTYDLRNCIDFRHRKNGSVFDTIDIPQPSSTITTPIKYYVPRIDLIFMAKGGRIGVVTGQPNDVPVVGALPVGTIAIGELNIAAYTKTIDDIKVTSVKNKVYTMLDVAKLENRLFNLEQYTLLSQTESSLVNYDVIDAATGKSRYKSGYLVENFDDPNIISDVYSENFLASYSGDMLYPRSEQIDVEMKYSTDLSTNCTNTGGLITLPYTTVVLAKQNVSTRVTNINPFAVYSWRGNMTLVPSIDNYVETVKLSTVFQNVTVNSVNLPRNWASWSPTQWATWANVRLPVKNTITPA